MNTEVHETLTEERPSMTDNDLKKKILLKMCYLISEIETQNDESEEKVNRGVLQDMKECNKDLENMLGLKISQKEKNAYIRLRKTNFDSEILKLTKYI